MALPSDISPKDTGQSDGNNAAGANSGSPTATSGATVDNNKTTSSTAATTTSTTDNPDDKDFDPSAEALIDEMDDERTLEEEEALDGNNAVAVQDELDELKRESEMPIEELLAYYERMHNAAGNQNPDQEEEEELDDEEDEDDEDEEGEDGEESTSEVRKQAASIDNTSKCSSQTALQQNHLVQKSHLHHNQEQQYQQQIDPSLPILPQQTNQLHSSMINTHHAHHTNDVTASSAIQKSQPVVTERANQLSTSSNFDATSQQQQTDIEPNLAAQSGRHKHSMTEFMIDSENVAGGMFKTLLDYDLDDSDDMDEDYSYTDDENGDDERDWRRSIYVGPDHQAEVPDGLSHYEGDLLPYEPEDKLVWRCNSNLNHEQIIDYLKRASKLSRRTDISVSPASVPKISEDNLRLFRERMLEALSPNAALNPDEKSHENINSVNPPENLLDMYMIQSRKRMRIDYELEQENAMDGSNASAGDVHPNPLSNLNKEDNSNSTSQDARPDLSTEEYFQDEEQLLYLLLQCNFNFEEALRRRGLDPFKYYLHEPMSLWSQEECLGFEHGLRIYGKNFRSIRENQVSTRTHAELVAFYYLWKKSERHDVYTNQYKLDRKRCLSHPGTTDYMDKFIEDNESALDASSSTPTPTDSTVDNQRIVDSSSKVDSPSIPICPSSNPRPSSDSREVERNSTEVHQSDLIRCDFGNRD